MSQKIVDWAGREIPERDIGFKPGSDTKPRLVDLLIEAIEGMEPKRQDGD